VHIHPATHSQAFVISKEADAIAALARWTEPWHKTFSSSRLISTGVLYAHVTSLVCAGGLALVADHASLLAGKWHDAMREHELRARSANRRLEKRALAVVALSGLLLFLSDVRTFVVLPAFWLKMVLVALLISNVVLTERSDDQPHPPGPVTARRRPAPHSRSRVHGGVKLVLWLLTLLAGTALVTG
jgi:hypothetical protein